MIRRLAGLVVLSLSLSAHAATTDFVPFWVTGSMGDGAGQAKIIAIDANGDGTRDLISCGADSPFMASRRSGSFRAEWFGRASACGKIAAADVDQNGSVEVFVATRESYGGPAPRGIHVFEVGQFAPRAFIPLTNWPTDVAVADLDGDGAMELAVSTAQEAAVYDARTLALEWTASGKGGTQIGIGDIDGDGRVDTIVNGNPAHVLDVQNRVEKWAYSGGFGSRFAVGNLDADAAAEIAYTNYYDLVAFDPGSLTQMWSVHNQWEAFQAVSIVDISGDGVAEVLTGNDQWGSIRSYTASGAAGWNVANPEHGVPAVTAAQLDSDPAIEIVWGSGWTSSGTDTIFVVDYATKATEWSAPDLDGPYSVAAADLDLDGNLEWIALSSSTDSGYSGPLLQVFDAMTRRESWSLASDTYNYYGGSTLGVGQLDNDAQKELIISSGSYSSTSLSYYDSSSKLKDGDSGSLPGAIRGSLVGNIDADAVDEILVALDNRQVYALHGATRLIQWTSEIFEGSIGDLSLGDVDGDGTQELAVITTSWLYVLDAATGARETRVAVSEGARVVIVPTRAGGAGRVFATRGSSFSSSPGSVVGFSGAGYASLGTCTTPAGVSDIFFSGGRIYLTGTAATRSFAAYDFRCATQRDHTRSPNAVSTAFFASPALGRGFLFGNNTSVEATRIVTIQNELSGDSNSDIVWSNSAAQIVATWHMDGANLKKGVVLPSLPSSQWFVAAIDDFDGDAHTDLLIRNASTGENRVRVMKDGATLREGNLPNAPTGMTPFAGDFNFDGVADLFWRDQSSGVNALWLLDETQQLIGGSLMPSVGTEYVVMGTGDADGDGDSDIYWRNAAGGITAIWMMRGGALEFGHALPETDPSLNGILGDLDGDGRTDIVWRHNVSGVNAVWLSRGVERPYGDLLPPIGDLNLEMVATGDYDADGRDDILWRHRLTGLNAIWFMDGTKIRSGAVIRDAAPDFVVVK